MSPASPLGGFLLRMRQQRAWRRRFEQTRAELDAYTDRELESDLRICRSDIASIATEAADRHVASAVRGA